MIKDPYDPVIIPDLSAQELFERANDAYNPNAISNTQAISDMRAAANKGHAQAQYVMGLVSFADLKFEAAAQWFEQSLSKPHANQNDARQYLQVLSKEKSMPVSHNDNFTTATQYLNGQGGRDQDEFLAAAFFSKAAAQGHEGARHAFEDLEKAVGARVDAMAATQNDLNPDMALYAHIQELSANF